MVKTSYKQQNLLDVGCFAMVKKGAEEKFGYKEGQTIYVAGSFWDQSTTNGYNYRKLFIVSAVNDGHVDLSGGHLFDGKYARRIKGKRAEILRAQLEADVTEVNTDEQVPD